MQYFPVPETYRDLFTFDYSKVPVKYHASGSPDDSLILYKGHIRGFQKSGLPSMALKSGKIRHLLDMKGIIEGGNEVEIRKIIDRHTDFYEFTPFVSASFNPEWAQAYALTSAYNIPGREKDTTIYRLQPNTKRCILDADDIGRVGKSKEFLILGMIFPNEIKAIKIINDNLHSELLTNFDGVPVIKRMPERESENTSVKDPTNWLEL
jgi:hypothetical protein